MGVNFSQENITPGVLFSRVIITPGVIFFRGVIIYGYTGDAQEPAPTMTSSVPLYRHENLRK